MKRGKKVTGVVTVVELMNLNWRVDFKFPVETMLIL
jgi:hypothetical protein